MAKRFLSVSLPHLQADILARRQTDLRTRPVALAQRVRSRMQLCSVNKAAAVEGIYPGMTVADARSLVPSLEVVTEELPDISESLQSLAVWCQRFSPLAGIQAPDGLILDISGCSHLWGGEMAYQQHIEKRLLQGGFSASTAIADTIGAAWALARFAPQYSPLPPGEQERALRPLSIRALRLDTATIDKLYKLGLYQIQDCLQIPRPALRRRFGQLLGERLDQALGLQAESFYPSLTPPEYLMRLPCPEPIQTATAISIALQQLLDSLCLQLKQEQKGLRQCILLCYRTDGEVQRLEIRTAKAVCNPSHLFHLFSLQIERIEPDLGIELFTLEATITETLPPEQEILWRLQSKESEIQTAVLLDKIRNYLPQANVQRFLPEERYWPEYAISSCSDLHTVPQTIWRNNIPRPIRILQVPQEIQVMVPIPDYPPAQFQYKGQIFRVVKADGPERIETEWWLRAGAHRDYYYVEDEQGNRYWLYREGHYYSETSKWYLHGFFA